MAVGLLSSDLGRELGGVFEQAARQGAVKAATPNFGEPPMVIVDRPVSELRVGLLVSLGARGPGQPALKATNDLTFHRISQSVPTSQIAFDHPSPIRYWAEQDLNVGFPRDRLAELAAEGAIGSLASTAITMLGSITLWDRLATETAPRIKGEFDSQGVDVVLVVPFCPGCHRAMMILARALEGRGMPTLTLSTLADTSEAFKPPRTALVEYPPGSPCGRVNDAEHQRETLRAALHVPLNVATRQVMAVPLTYQADGGQDWVQQTLRLYREGANVVLDDAVAHGKTDSLAGQEEQFSIRCSC
jgi:D-proline reductase (dithiol) PrdB